MNIKLGDRIAIVRTTNMINSYALAWSLGIIGKDSSNVWPLSSKLNKLKTSIPLSIGLTNKKPIHILNI